MATNPLSISIPQPQIPFLNDSGGLSREWLYYMLSMLNRTGGVKGISSANLEEQVQAHSVMDAMEDIAFPSPFPAVSVFSVLDDVPPQVTSIFAAVLLALATADDAPPAPLNPFLASLVVSDVV